MANNTDHTENTTLNCVNPEQKEEKITWEDGDSKNFKCVQSEIFKILVRTLFEDPRYWDKQNFTESRSFYKQ